VRERKSNGAKKERGKERREGDGLTVVVWD